MKQSVPVILWHLNKLPRVYRLPISEWTRLQGRQRLIKNYAKVVERVEVFARPELFRCQGGIKYQGVFANMLGIEHGDSEESTRWAD